MAKFRDNAARVLTPNRVSALERTIVDLDHAADVTAISALCRIA
jgi:hypothetical protein